MSEYMNPIKSVSINFNNKPLLTIHPDGRVTTSPRLKPTEAAALVLDQIKTHWMNDSQATNIRELQERIKRLEEAGDELLMWLKEDISESDGQLLQGAWIKAKEAKL